MKRGNYIKMGNVDMNLIIWQQKYINGFDSVAIDISGFCNAKCKYCPAGDDLSCKGEFIHPETYKMILERLISNKLLTPMSKLHIYCLGEPLLHPNIDEILRITKEFGLKTSLSTNASVVPNISDEASEAVDRILISMPGFSQSSYDKIHGFNFEKIKENIIRIRKIFDKKPFDMSYHIYQFNMNEMEDARNFCKENFIRFSPNYAVLMDKNKCKSYIENTMPYEELKDISKELFLGVLDYQISVAPRNYCDFQERFLSVTINGDIRICSSFTKDFEENILCGNILIDDVNEIIKRKYTFSYCEECKRNGLTLTEGSDCKVWPDSYYSLMKENEILYEGVKCKNTDIVLDELQVMKCIRKWEERNYDDVFMLDVKSKLQSACLLKEQIKEIIFKYTRFPKKTWEVINEEIL
jgi:MoaA/NifB/PqqE/SkfB family radical SAM enzyme